MKKLILLMMMTTIFIFTCAQQDRTKLKKDSPAYKLAQELSEKIPALDPEQNKIIVTTNKFTITTGEIINLIYSNSGANAQRLKNMPEDYLKQSILNTAKTYAENRLLLMAATKANISATKAQVDSVLALHYKNAGDEKKFKDWLFQNKIKFEVVKKDLQERIIISTYLSRVRNTDALVSDEEIQKNYAEDKLATVQHILLLTQGKNDAEKVKIYEKMKTVLAQAKKGQDFAALAKKYSEDPGSKDKGGIYENFPRGQMVKPFEDAAFSVPVGSISDIIETQYGYHILKVIDRKKETRPFEEFRTEYLRQKNQLAQENHKAALKKEAEMKIITL